MGLGGCFGGPTGVTTGGVGSNAVPTQSDRLFPSSSHDCFPPSKRLMLSNPAVASVPLKRQSQTTDDAGREKVLVVESRKHLPTFSIASEYTPVSRVSFVRV